MGVAVLAGTRRALEQAQGAKKREISVVKICIKLYSMSTVQDPLTCSNGETQEGVCWHIIPPTGHNRPQNCSRCAPTFHFSHPGQGRSCGEPVPKHFDCQGYHPLAGPGDKGRLCSAEIHSIPWKCWGQEQSTQQEFYNPEGA